MKKNYASGNKGGQSFGGNRGGGGDRRGGFGGNRGGRDGEKPQMHPATCSGCKSRTEVPFRPTGDKPVYCRDCFASQNNDRGNDRGGDRGFNKKDKGGDRGSFVGFKKHNDASTGTSTQKLEKQLESIYTKLDQILGALLNNSQPDNSAKKKEESPEKEKFTKPVVNKEDVKKAIESALETKTKKEPVVKDKTSPKKTSAKKVSVKKATTVKKTSAKNKTPAKKTSVKKKK